MDWHNWIRQHIPSSPIQRSGVTAWPKGAGGLLGDSLGPIMHLHDGASEIFYFVSGRCRLEIGDSDEVFGPGEFVLVPPEVPHNLWNAGDDDLRLLWVVAPNFVHNKWRTDNFPPGAMDRRAIRSQVSPGVRLPCDANVQSTVVTVAPSEGWMDQTGPNQESLFYVVSGQVEFQTREESALLESQRCVHIPAATSYSLRADGGPATMVLITMPAPALGTE